MPVSDVLAAYHTCLTSEIPHSPNSFSVAAITAAARCNIAKNPLVLPMRMLTAGEENGREQKPRGKAFFYVPKSPSTQTLSFQTLSDFSLSHSFQLTLAINNLGLCGRDSLSGEDLCFSVDVGEKRRSDAVQGVAVAPRWRWRHVEVQVEAGCCSCVDDLGRAGCWVWVALLRSWCGSG